jgi:DNA-binding transcriptional ArsR family regulator
MFEDKIILDDTSFKALSSESRVSILKNLNNRRMTLSELSKRLELENSTIKEHCNLLVRADLIKQIDEGRKWKYYELTNKGKTLIQPNLVEQIKVLVVLCLGAVMFGGILTLIIQPTDLISNGVYSPETNTDLLAKSMDAPNSLEDSFTTQEVMAVNEINSTQEFDNQPAPITKELLIASISLSIIAGLIIGWISAKKY